MIKSRLGWLSGFPVWRQSQLVWIFTDGGFYHDQMLGVDAQVISRSQRTVNTLLRDYPVALPAVVGDAVLWHRRCLDYIQYAKQLIANQTTTIPSLFAWDALYGSEYSKWIKTQADDGFLVMLSWKHYLKRSGLRDAIQFMAHPQNVSERHVEPLMLLNLNTLFITDKNKSLALIGFAAAVAEHTHLTHASREYFTPYLKLKTLKAVKKHSKSFQPQAFPISNLKHKFEGFLKQISRYKGARRRRCLEFFKYLEFGPEIQQWQQWWSEIETLCQKMTNHIRLGQVTDSAQVLALRAQIKQLHDEQPRALDLVQWLSTVDELSHHKANCAAITNAIKPLNEVSHLPSVIDFMAFWAELISDTQPHADRFKAYLLGLCKYLTSQPKQDEQGSPWLSLPSYAWGSIDATLLRRATVEQINRFFAALLAIKNKPVAKVQTKHLNGLWVLVRAGFAVEAIVQLYPALRQHEQLVDLHLLVAQIAFELDLTADELLTVLAVRKKLLNEDQYFDGMAHMYRLLNDLNQSDFFKRLLLHHDQNQWFNDSYQLRVVAKISGKHAIPLPAAIDGCPAPWIEQYPTAFHPLLQQLNSLNKQAEKKVKSVFKAIWWPKSFITAAIDELTKQRADQALNQTAIKQRIKKLKAKRDKHQRLTAHKAEKITHKLTALNHRLYFAAWQTKLKEKFIQDWCTLFGLELSTVPPWLTKHDMVNRLLPIIDFAAASKKLAIKVIRARCQGPFYHLEKERANTQFIHKLNDDGFDMTVWPAQLGSHSYRAENGELITLAVAADPLEVIDMGGHFGTCLSPGNFNYFSVFTNIADVNKQVIYARNERNQVVGRVLIGVTNQGALQVFNKYAHHKSYDFAEQVMAYIEQIATRTGLVLSNQGQVAALCCDQWYDDGATHIKHAYPCMADGSEFRQQIPTMHEADFVTKLTNALAPQKITALVFPALLAIHEVKDNPQLLPALIRLSLTIDNLPVSDLLALYDLAGETDQAAEVYQCHRQAILRYLLAQTNPYYYGHLERYIVSMASHHPSDALRILKAQGKAMKIDWRTELQFTPKQAAYIALKKLGRDRMAEVYRPT